MLRDSRGGIQGSRQDVKTGASTLVRTADVRATWCLYFEPCVSVRFFLVCGMRWLSLYLVLLTSTALGQNSLNAQGEFQPSPHFEAEALPVPPVQSHPWSAPKLAKRFHGISDVAEQLFESGLADPRACEYRAIKVAVGTCSRGDAGVVETRAWVLPETPAGG